MLGTLKDNSIQKFGLFLKTTCMPCVLEEISHYGVIAKGNQQRMRVSVDERPNIGERRQAQEVDEVYQELKDKHADKYSSPKLCL